MGRHMLTAEQHLDNLVRHIELVREACLLLGKRLIARDRQELGRILIAHGWNDLSCPFMGSVLTVDQMPVTGDPHKVRTPAASQIVE